MSRQSTERLIMTAIHCNPQQFLYGNVSSTTVSFGYKFSAQPCVMTSIVGTGTVTSMTYNKDGNGYYVSVTLTYTCSSVNFLVIGVGIKI